MLWRHFRDLHPFDKVIVPKEGYFPRCERCFMKVNPSYYPRHVRTKECQVGMDRRLQRESAIASALALSQEFMIHGGMSSNESRFSSTSAACSCRMTMMHTPSASRCGRQGEYGPESGRFNGAKTLNHALPPSSTRRWSWSRPSFIWQ